MDEGTDLDVNLPLGPLKVAISSNRLYNATLEARNVGRGKARYSGNQANWALVISAEFKYSQCFDKGRDI